MMNWFARRLTEVCNVHRVRRRDPASCVPVVQAVQINHAVALFRLPHAWLGLLVLASETLPLPGESR